MNHFVVHEVNIVAFEGMALVGYELSSHQSEYALPGAYPASPAALLGCTQNISPLLGDTAVQLHTMVSIAAE